MGIEYELCKPEAHEFIELGKGSFGEIADILLKAKMESLPYEEVWQFIENCNFIKEMKDSCVYSDLYQIFDYLFWLKEFFFKKVYKWYSCDVRLITDEEFAECYENNGEFKLICSRYTTEASKAEFIRTHKKDYLNAVKGWKKECEEKRNSLDNLQQLKHLNEQLKHLNEGLLKKLVGVRAARKREKERHRQELENIRKYHKQELSYYSSKRLIAERDIYKARYFFVIDYYRNQGIISDEDVSKFEDQFYEMYDSMMSPIDKEEEETS